MTRINVELILIESMFSNLIFLKYWLMSENYYCFNFKVNLRFFSISFLSVDFCLDGVWIVGICGGFSFKIMSKWVVKFANNSLIINRVGPQNWALWDSTTNPWKICKIAQFSPSICIQKVAQTSYIQTVHKFRSLKIHCPFQMTQKPLKSLSKSQVDSDQIKYRKKLNAKNEPKNWFFIQIFKLFSYIMTGERWYIILLWTNVK